MNETHFPDWDNEMAVLRLDATVWARRANIVVKAALFVMAKAGSAGARLVYDLGDPRRSLA